jgi:hypothetical protein
VGSPANALLSLLSSIVGGTSVLAGQFFARRADLATSYFQEAAPVNDARRSGKATNEVPATTYVVDRQKALGRFRALPSGSAFEPERRRMGGAVTALWRAWDGGDSRCRDDGMDIHT